MLTTTPQQLQKLSLKEQLLRSYEQTDRGLERFRLSDHQDLKDAEKRMGKPLMHSELIRRVEKVTHKRIWAETSYRDSNISGFYHLKNREKTFICAFDNGPMPEFSIILTDNADLPIKEKRGWRTVLTRLLQSGSISWSEVVYGFGDGMTHQANARWDFNTREFRNK